MENIMLTAHQTPMEQFDLYYKFLSAQILDELGRIKNLKAIRNDSTPAHVEADLLTAIMTTLQRFEIYDNQHTIAYGYKISSGTGINIKSYLEKKMSSIFPHPVTIKSLRNETQNVPVTKSCVEKFIAKINLSKMELVQMEDEWKPGWYLDNITHDMVYDMTKKASGTITDTFITTDTRGFFHPKENVAVKIKVFKVMKNIASVPALRNVNLTVKAMVDMLWGDLLDDAILLEKGTDVT